jgi:mannose-1-phosphate guanylyltransferase / mannose-6-phosphate isomerase
MTYGFNREQRSSGGYESAAAVVPVIISGGAGSRLWPMSRETHPKPFIPLPEGGTLIGKTCARAARLNGVGRIVTVTNRELLFLTADACAETKAPVENTFLLEPMGRDTAAAVALATLHVAQTQGREAVLLILPADHLIRDEVAFANAVAQAQSLALAERIVTFGIRPDRPETGFGYIEVNGTDVLRFVEKPDAKTAAQYMASGRFFWNSGMFCFTARTMMDAMETHCPDVLTGARAALDLAKSKNDDGRLVIEVDAPSFAVTPAISIDYAVMEKAKNVACVPVECGWSDIGSWATVAELVTTDKNGNCAVGEMATEDAENCFVYSEDRLVGLVGVSNLLVVDSPDALLVARKDKAQEVKHLYNRLKTAGHEVTKLHRTVHRPWGTYTVLEEGERFKIKRIEVRPGARLSLQAHHHRAEHWVVVSGTAKVVNGEKEMLLATNQSTYIPCGHKHRLENPGILPLVLIEVQSGEYLGEDDIVRFDDIYGRA